MADSKLTEQDHSGSQTPSEKEKSENGSIHHEDTSDVSSNHDSVSGTSADDGPIVPPLPTGLPIQNGAKKALSKQPSNGIHVLKPDDLSQTAIDPPPYSSGDASMVATIDGSKTKEPEDEISFDPNGSYYMANACCELLHYRTAATLVGICELALIALWGLIIGFYYYSTGEIVGAGSVALICAQAALAAAFVVIIILMLFGVMSERPFLLWPHMAVQITGIALGISFTICSVITMCAGTSLAETVFSGLFGSENLPVMEKYLGPIWPFCLAVVFDFSAALGIWFFIVVKGCYEYLMDKAFFEEHFNNVHNVKKVNLDVNMKK